MADIYNHITLRNDLEIFFTFDTCYRYTAFQTIMVHDVSGNQRHDNDASEDGALYLDAKVGPYSLKPTSTSTKVDTGWYGDEILSNNPRTFAFWIKTTTSASGGIMGYGRHQFGYSGQGWHVFLNTNATYGTIGALRVDIRDGRCTGTKVLNDGQWHYCVIRFSGTTLNDVDFVVDGQADAFTYNSGSTVNTTSSHEFTVGLRNYYSGTTYFDGQIDQFGAWSRRLTNDEADDLWNGGDGLQYFPDSESLEARCDYDFDGDGDYFELTQTNGAEDFEPAAGSDFDFSFAMLVKFNRVPFGGGSGWGETHDSCILAKRGLIFGDANALGWRVYLYGDPAGSDNWMYYQVRYENAVSAKITVSNNIGIIQIPVNTYTLIGMTFDGWDGSSAKLRGYYIDAIDGTQQVVNSLPADQPNDFTSTDSFWIAGNSAGYDSDIKVYWATYKPGVIWSQSDFEDMFNHVLNESVGQAPESFSPQFYIDFSQVYTYDPGPMYELGAQEIEIGPNAPYPFNIRGGPVPTCGWPLPIPETSFMSHEFTVSIPHISTSDILGHEFAVSFPPVSALDILGHQFTVPSTRKLLSDISSITRKRLG